MATTAPMKDVLPAGSGTGGDPRVTISTPSTSSSSTTTNFEYDDNEWEIGISNLIIDLDADIQKTNEKSNINNNAGNLTSTIAESLMAATSVTNVASGGSRNGNNSNKSCSSGSGSPSAGGSSAPTGINNSSSTSGAEHSLTVDSQCLKMKIKRTKSGNKSCEKHEIVKPNKQNCGEEAVTQNSALTTADEKSSTCISTASNVNQAMTTTTTSTNFPASGSTSSVCGAVNSGSNKRGVGGGGSNSSSSNSSISSGHKRDKTKEKLSTTYGQQTATNATTAGNATGSSSLIDLNSTTRTPMQRITYPIQTNGSGNPNITGTSGPPKDQNMNNSLSLSQVTATSVESSQPNATCLDQSVTLATIGVTDASNGNSIVEKGNLCAAVGAREIAGTNSFKATADDTPSLRPLSPSSPLCKKIKTANCLVNDGKETKNACVGTSISTMTEPDCIGPCEPGTSVTLEGIVWHETEGVLVVNVTWRGKTYIGTLLDCTRHDWAPPRFCNSPTSDLDARLPKGRAKRGRTATSDFSNFTETRSSVHSKLRSSSSGSSKSTRKGLSNSPTQFVSPRTDPATNKRKSRSFDEELTSPQANVKKCKSSITAVSPPSSPVFFECPETNCYKKYKHLNGLKYHQSHAHGSPSGAGDEDATKESASMSETEEMSSPKGTQSIKSEKKDENFESEPAPSVSESIPVLQNQPSSPQTQASDDEPIRVELTPPCVDNKTVVKPEVLRYGVPVSIDDDNVSKSPNCTSAAPITATLPPNNFGCSSENSTSKLAVTQNCTSTSPPLQVPLSPCLFSSQENLAQSLAAANPKPYFKIKLASVLLQNDKLTDQDEDKIKGQAEKKKRDSPQPEQFHPKREITGREEVQSPAYSDISDDGTPLLEAEIADLKNKPMTLDKKSTESSEAPSPHAMQHYSVHPFYAQSPYLVPSIQPDKIKEEIKNDNDKVSEKEKKNDVSQKLLSPHFYPYESYVANYGYNLSQNYPVPLVPTNQKEIKEENQSSGPTDLVKQPSSNSHPTHYSIKSKDTSAKVPADSFPAVKEGSEARNASAYPHSQHTQQVSQHSHLAYCPPQSRASPQLPTHHHQAPEDMRRYYGNVYPDQRRKDHLEAPSKVTPPPNSTNQKTNASASSSKHKEKQLSEKKEDKVKQGVKPTMETQGPPPPPISAYAYFHPSSYLQPPYVPFDPATHSVYRGINSMMMPTSPYGNSPYLHQAQMHHQMSRYHAHEDLSRPSSGAATKALDLLHHQASQYYSPSHKIHELQERALKSPNPKVSTQNPVPLANANRQPNALGPAHQLTPTSTAERFANSASTQRGESLADAENSRSPPPQRHVHTHHHTHVGLGYPLLPAQYSAPYGAAVLGSEQAAAVASAGSNPYSSK